MSEKTAPELVYINCMLNVTRQNHALALQLFKQLFQELPKQIAEIENNLNAGEMVPAQFIVHKLHGSMSFCGFTKLQTLANLLENSLVASNLAQAKPLFLQFKQELTLLQSLQEAIFLYFGEPV